MSDLSLRKKYGVEEYSFSNNEILDNYIDNLEASLRKQFKKITYSSIPFFRRTDSSGKIIWSVLMSPATSTIVSNKIFNLLEQEREKFIREEKLERILK